MPEHYEVKVAETHLFLGASEATIQAINNLNDRIQLEGVSIETAKFLLRHDTGLEMSDDLQDQVHQLVSSQFGLSLSRPEDGYKRYLNRLDVQAGMFIERFGIDVPPTVTEYSLVDWNAMLTPYNPYYGPGRDNPETRYTVFVGSCKAAVIINKVEDPILELPDVVKEEIVRGVLSIEGLNVGREEHVRMLLEEFRRTNTYTQLDSRSHLVTPSPEEVERRIVEPRPGMFLAPWYIFSENLLDPKG
jgi:hypothetical protein